MTQDLNLWLPQYPQRHPAWLVSKTFKLGLLESHLIQNVLRSGAGRPEDDITVKLKVP